MQGLGNDFVVFDATRHQLDLSPAQIRRIADRHFGIGCDQVLLVEPSRSAETDFFYRIFNADASEVEQCGNGARCFMRFIHDKGMTRKRDVRVGTRSGVIVPHLEADGQVTVDMGLPRFEPNAIPFLVSEQALTYELDLRDKVITISALSMGNPHAVQVVEDLESAPVALDGPRTERHPLFPQRVNAGYMQVLGRRHIGLRVYERGAGETLACGTGACAAVVAGITRGMLESPVTVTTRGGDLTLAWRGLGTPVMMTGPAQTVFEGAIEL